MTTAMARARDDIQVFVGAAEQILRSHRSEGTSLKVQDTPMSQAIRSSHMVHVPQSLLNLPMDFATLELDLADSDGDVDGDNDGEDSTHSRRGVRCIRKWSVADRERLRGMKQKGWADNRIGRILGRSPSAIAQQWRKQKD
jgi:hypothetical protein